MNQNGNVLTINQGTDRLIMGWNSFSIGAGETTRFVQPSSSSFALNRVTGGTQSLINGHLEANGGVILINPAGIIVGNSGVVNVNSFIASTRDVTDSDFLSGKSMKFQGNSEASIQNLGTIHAESGDIYLIAHSIINSGTLSAEKGTVGLAAANEVLLQPAGDEKLSILTQESSGGKIVNSGTIRAVTAEIKAAGNPYAVAINLDGVIETHAHPTSGAQPKVTIRATQGDIQMSSGSKITANGKSTSGQVTIQTIGNLEISGTVLATSSAGTGGTINLLGKNIHLDPSVVVDASGFLGGGKIFVGGDYQGGKNAAVHYSDTPLPTAQTLQVDQGAKLSANATGDGNGGVVIQWSDGTTVSSGSVSVQGGPLGGNGGFSEISGKQNLGFNGTVDLAAPNGKAGTVLFDPSTLYIHDGDNTADGSLSTSGSLYISGSPYDYWLSTAVINSIAGGTVLLQANNVQFSDPEGINLANITLQPNVNLQIQATSDNLVMPTGSSITTSGSGWVNLIAYKDFNFGGTISSVNGGVTLESYYGNLNLSPGSSITQSGNSGITLLADNGSILGSSALSTPSGWVRLQAQNNNGSIIENHLVGSLDFSGSINAGYWIDIYGGNEITLNGAVSSSSSTVNLRANNSITLGSTPPLSTKTTISTAIVGSAPTTISASGSLYLNAPVLSFINTPVLSAEALSGSFGSINSSSVGLSSSTPLTKGYDGTSAITLLPTDLLINGLDVTSVI
jgi:filamentous hemagglutinin family protein